MSDVINHRFLPTVRRGVASHVGPIDEQQPLPARADVSVGLTVSGLTTSPAIDLTAYGPGDVTGLDTRLIVRTDPVPGASDVEPNFFPAVDFDPPDLPWMMTPAQADPATGRLRPWLVLVCVDRAVVSPPTVEPGALLPVLKVPAAVVATELPDLSESWAWAHAQVTTASGQGAVGSKDLVADTKATASRILCPRRLQPGRSWVACLVPAFDAGVFRGLTGAQPAAETLSPAWTSSAQLDVRLPVYYHWEFSTGPLGGFEELARRLELHEVDDGVGYSKMYVGGAGGGGAPTGALPSIPAADHGAHVLMDGALRAPSGSSGQLGDVDQRVRHGLRARLDGPADAVDAGAPATTPEMGPPLYGQWHVREHRVPTDRPRWFRELNVDPRGRVAASLGAEIVRARQEDFMGAAWEQVGDVLKANEILNGARLAQEALTAMHRRHFAALPSDRLIQLTAPLHGRVLLGSLTLPAVVRGTSLPDLATDAAFRRLTSAQSPKLKKLARSQGMNTDAHGGLRLRLLQSLAASRADVEPNTYVPDGLADARLLRGRRAGRDRSPVSLAGSGLTGSALSSDVRTVRAAARVLAKDGPGKLKPRIDLRATGLVTEAHVRALDSAPLRSAGNVESRLPRTLSRLREAARLQPRNLGFLVEESPGSEPVVSSLELARGRELVARGDGGATRVVAEVEGGRRVADSRALAREIAVLAPGSIGGAGRGTVPRVDVSSAGTPRLRRGGRTLRPAGRGSNTIPPLLTDDSVIRAFEHAITTAPAPDGPRTAPSLVPIDFTTAGVAVLDATRPTVTIPARVGKMLTLDGVGLFDTTAGRFRVSGGRDRVLAGPELPAPAYEYLAAYDPERFLPGVGTIPDDSICLLETNPRFVEAFMVGINYEMNRELLWRGYPTDQRGTPFRHFWGWLDGSPDISPIHSWSRARKLGNNTRGGGGGQLVLLLRGRLLRRYPRTLIYAWRGSNSALVDPPKEGDIVAPVFAGRFDPDLAFAGFPLTDEDLAKDEWFFVLQEPPAEPRFGFDEPLVSNGGGTPASWSDANWNHVGTTPGAHLRIDGNPLDGLVLSGTRFVSNAAHLAAISLQKPVRVAIASTHLYSEESP